MTRLHVRLSGHQSQPFNRVRTCLYTKMRPCIDWFSDRAPISPFRYWLGCIINTSGYDFRKGQAVERYLADFMTTTFGFRFSVHTALN
jgi:hypothetical protein